MRRWPGCLLFASAALSVYAQYDTGTPLAIELAALAPVTLLVALLSGTVWALRAHSARRSTLAVVAILVIAAPILFDRVARPGAEGRRGAMPLRLVTANVYRFNATPGAAIATLIATNADVIVLQEAMSLRDHAAPLKARYPFATQCRVHCDLRIFSRLPFAGPRRVLRARMPEHDRRTLLDVIVRAPDGAPVRIAATHYVRPIPAARQEAVRRAIAAAIAGDANDLILAGDMNTAAWSPAMRAQDRRFKPLVRWSRVLPTYPAIVDFGGRRWNWPFAVVAIDHVYAAPRWRGSHVTRLRIPGSDHFAIALTLRRSAGPKPR